MKNDKINTVNSDKQFYKFFLLSVCQSSKKIQDIIVIKSLFNTLKCMFWTNVIILYLDIGAIKSLA